MMNTVTQSCKKGRNRRLSGLAGCLPITLHTAEWGNVGPEGDCPFSLEKQGMLLLTTQHSSVPSRTANSNPTALHRKAHYKPQSALSKNGMGSRFYNCSKKEIHKNVLGG